MKINTLVTFKPGNEKVMCVLKQLGGKNKQKTLT